MQPYELSLAAAADAIRARRLSPVELVDSVLHRIEEVDPHLGAYVTVTAERARRAAAEAEHEVAHGRYRGPLHGVPMGLKDLIDVDGMPTTASPVSARATERERTARSPRAWVRPAPSCSARPTPTSSRSA